MSAKILITGGRAAVGVDLARYFKALGHEVYVVDSWERHLCAASNAVKESFHTASPNRAFHDYKRDLLRIIEEKGITHVIPVSEEAFYLAAVAPSIPKNVRVWIETSDKLRQVHDKAAFNQLAREMGLQVPETRVVHSRSELLQTLRDLRLERRDFVLKPAFSRFADKTAFSWTRKDFETRLEDVRPKPTEAWLVQERIKGEELCTYSVALEGKLLAHVNYSHEFTAGPGAGICFESIDRPILNEWVEKFVRETKFTGQLAFDFILPEGGGAYALECNPRGTSGIHLFSEESERLTRAFLLPETVTSTLSPEMGRLGMTTSLAMIIYGIPQIRSYRKLKEWIRVFFKARDALMVASDRGPFLEQFAVLSHLQRASRSTGLSMLACSTLDIEWNGESLAEAGVQNEKA